MCNGCKTSHNQSLKVRVPRTMGTINKLNRTLTHVGVFFLHRNLHPLVKKQMKSLHELSTCKENSLFFTRIHEEIDSTFQITPLISNKQTASQNILNRFVFSIKISILRSFPTIKLYKEFLIVLHGQDHR